MPASPVGLLVAALAVAQVGATCRDVVFDHLDGFCHPVVNWQMESSQLLTSSTAEQRDIIAHNSYSLHIQHRRNDSRLGDRYDNLYVEDPDSYTNLTRGQATVSDSVRFLQLQTEMGTQLKKLLHMATGSEKKGAATYDEGCDDSCQAARKGSQVKCERQCKVRHYDQLVTYKKCRATRQCCLRAKCLRIPKSDQEGRKKCAQKCFTGCNKQGYSDCVTKCVALRANTPSKPSAVTTTPNKTAVTLWQGETEKSKLMARKWRVMNANRMKCWNVCDLKMYTDTYCNDEYEIFGGNPFESTHRLGGPTGDYDVSNAFTGERCGTGGTNYTNRGNDSFWSPICAKDAETLVPARATWLGLEFTKPTEMWCIKMAQHPHPDGQVNDVLVQYFNETDGKWANAFQATGMESDGSHVSRGGRPQPIKALHFNGAQSSGAVAKSASNQNFATTELTVEMWVKTASSGKALFSYQSGAHVEAGLWDASNLEGVIGQLKNHKSGVQVNDGKWHHVAWTWSSELGASRVYRDAELKSIRQDVFKGHNLAQGLSLYIGASPGADGKLRQSEAFQGDMSLVKVWKVARDPMQVFQDMTSGVPEMDMVAFFRFDTAAMKDDSSPAPVTTGEEAPAGQAGPYKLTMSDGTVGSEFDWDLRAIKKPATLGTPKAIKMLGSTISFAKRSASAVAGMGKTAITVEMWIKTNDGAKRGASDMATLFSFSRDSGDSGDELSLTSPSNLRGTVGGQAYKSPVDVADGKWHHVAWTWDNGVGASRLYRDAVLMHVHQDLKKGYVIQGAGGGSGQMFFGKRKGSTQARECLAATLAQIKVWSTARAQAQVTADMTSSKPDASGLVSFLKFDPKDSLGKDSTPAGNDMLMGQVNMVENDKDLAEVVAPRMNATVSRVVRLDGSSNSYLKWGGGKPGSSHAPKDFPSLSAFTFEAWVKTRDGRGAILSYATRWHSKAIVLRNPSNLAGCVAQNCFDSGASINDGQWHHVAMAWSYSKKELRIVVDGVVRGLEGEVNRKPAGSGTLYIGQEQSRGGSVDRVMLSSSGRLEAEISMIKMWRTERSPVQIQADMQALEPPTSGSADAGKVLGFFKFNPVSSHLGKDSSASANDLVTSKVTLVTQEFGGAAVADAALAVSKPPAADSVGAVRIQGKTNSYGRKGNLDSGRFASTELTVELWVKTTLDKCGLVSYAVSQGQGSEISLYDPANLLAVVNGGGGGGYQRGGFAVNDGAWHHVTWTWSSASGVSKLYKDGALQKTQTNMKRGHVIEPSSSNQRRNRAWWNSWTGYPVLGYLYIGGQQGSYGGGMGNRQMLDGALALVKIWRVVRTDQQVLQDMTSLNPHADMVSFYKFDTMSGASVAMGHDSTNNIHLNIGDVGADELEVDLGGVHGTKSKWRVANAGSTKCWNLCSLQFFSDPSCADEIKGGNVIESGHFNSNDGSKATSGRGACGNNGVVLNDHFWSAGCGSNTMSPRSAWLGFEWATSQSVKCIKLAQYPIKSSQVSSVVVQYYDVDTASWKTEWEAAGVNSDGDFVENSFNDNVNTPVASLQADEAADVAAANSTKANGTKDSEAVDASGDAEKPDLPEVKRLPLVVGPEVDDESQFEDVIGNLKPIEDTTSVNWKEVTSCDVGSVKFGNDATQGGKNITGMLGPGFACQQALRKYVCQMQFPQCVTSPPLPNKPDFMEGRPQEVHDFIMEPKTDSKGPCRSTCDAVNTACNMGPDDGDRLTCEKLPKKGCIGNLYGTGDFDLNDALSPKRLIPTQVNAPKVPSEDNSGHDDQAY